MSASKANPEANPVRWQRKAGRAAMVSMTIAIAGGLAAFSLDRVLLQPDRIRSEQIDRWKLFSAKIKFAQQSPSWKQWFLNPDDCRSVEYLVLKDDRQIDANVKAIMDHQRIRGLVLHGPKVTTAHIITLRRHPSLELICAIGTDVDNQMVQAEESPVEVRYMRLPPIVKMDKQQIRYTTLATPVSVGAKRSLEASAALTEMISEPLLRRIDMRNVLVDRDTIEAMAKAEVCQVLWVGYGFDDSMADLLPRFENVVYLDLSQSMVTDVGIQEVLKMPNLKSLALGPNMTDATMAVLSQSTTIKEVNCKDSQVGDQGVIAMQKSPSLTSINLSGRLITGKAMQSLTQYKQLREVLLEDCIHLTKKDLEWVFKMQNLQRIGLDAPNGLRDRIQRRMPKVEFLGGAVYGE